MTKDAFRSAAIKWLALLFAVSLSPLLLFAIFRHSGICADANRVCFPYFYLTVRPAALSAIVIMVVWLVYKRCAILGLGIGWPIALLLWLLGALPLLAVGMVYTWKVSWLEGLFTASGLDLLAFALSLIAFLSYANGSAVHSDRSDLRLARSVAIAAAVHITRLRAPSIVLALGVVPFGSTLPFRLLPLNVVLMVFADAASFGLTAPHRLWMQWFDFAVFSGALSYLIAHQTGDEGRASASEHRS